MDISNSCEILGICFSTVPIVSGIKPRRSRILAVKRIGPHSRDALSIFFGSLMGDAHAEKRESGSGTRITFQQEHVHVSYGLWLHALLLSLGYASSQAPQISTRLTGGRVRKLIRFSTFTYTSLNWVREVFYDTSGIKRVPDCLASHLTPLALAI